MRKVDLGKVYSQVRINAQKKKPPYSTKGKVYASSLGCKCEWKLRFTYLDCPIDEDRFIWDGYEADIGTAIHDFIQKDALGEGILTEAETWQRLKVGSVVINCKIDGLFIDGRLKEYKTIGEKDKLLVQKAPKREHVIQANVYLGAKKLDHALITYVCRERGKHVVTWEIDFDQHLYNQTLDKVKRVSTNKDLVKDKSECRFCVYKNTCKGGIK